MGRGSYPRENVSIQHILSFLLARNAGKCCVGYKWNDKNKTCDECDIGYEGYSCTNICPYPTYGIACQEICDCNKSKCDYRYGCKIIAVTEKDEHKLITNIPEKNWTNGNSMEIKNSIPLKDPCKKYDSTSTTKRLFIAIICLVLIFIILIAAHIVLFVKMK
ncbi:multiple epidermal growth factor-like domains protein 10 [Saccostrea cucullata]|uniref:multiple epidermal growth factor-like domains protein 10 n=1 Tax=Saccostrea cuccullata TaxID=36930 RepID=UPI002ED3B9F9